MTFLFDLDGTLTDSEQGIIHSVQYALKHFGIDADSVALRSFIGPPLYDSFRNTMGMSDTDACTAVAVYREYFRDKGLYENALYPGICALLKKLHDSGHRLAVATSKPEIFAKRITAHFGLDPFLEHVCGAELEGPRSAKPAVIGYALEQLGVSTAVMIGDRKYDILGAQEHGLAGVGVLYGYGSREELEQAGADHIVATVGEMESLLAHWDERVTPRVGQTDPV